MITEVLRHVGTFSSGELAMIETYLERRELRKNDVLLPEGQVCRSVYFLVTGAFYQFRLNDVDEQIIDLHIEGDWFLNHLSFISQKPSDTTIKAYVPSEVLELSIFSLHELIAHSPNFLQLGKLLEFPNLRTRFFDHSMTPLQKYQLIVADRPLLLQKFPLKYIASYLKITPETLSRVRGLH